MAGSQIKGKTVLVQGASRGIGLEFVRQLAAKGNTVVATCREPQKALELAKLKDVTITQLDVASPEAIQQWAKSLGNHAQHFDYVLNIAGHLGQADIETATAEQMLFDYKVRTDMTRGAGFISVQESVSGLIANVLEGGKDLNGTWHDFAGKEIPW
eukprot:jgi/Astpho2/4204/Aster-05168